MIESNSQSLKISPNTLAPTAPVRVHLWHKRRITMVVTLLLLAGITLYQLATLSTANVHFGAASVVFFKNAAMIFLQPGLSGTDSLADLLTALAISAALATLTTLLGAIVAFFIGLFAATNLANRRISLAIKTGMAIIRAIPTILWVLIFSIVIGLGADAAVIGLSFHSIAYLTKAYAESFEDLNQEAIEALQATGASWWKIIFQAVLPSSLPMLLSWTFIRFEINFTNAIAVGAAAGAGGIGYQLFTASSFYFDFHEIGVIIYLCLAVTACLEFISVKLRKRYLK